MNLAETSFVHTAGTPIFVTVLAIVRFALALTATLRCIWVGKKDLSLPLWLLLTWLVPIVGPLLTICLVRRETRHVDP